jgi:hypothetical protein
MIQKLIFRFTFAAILSLSGIIYCTAQPDAGFSSSSSGKYYSYSGKFKISFPKTPTESNSNIETDMGTVTLHQFMYESETSAYMVGYSEYPADKMEGRDKSVMLENAKSGFCSSLNITVTNSGSSNVGSYDGIWFDATDYSGYYAVMRDFLIGNRLYQIGILSTEPISERLKYHFLNSFEIVE